MDVNEMGKAERTKGHSFERLIAIKFRKLFPRARRHLEYHAGDANGIDIDNVGDFRIQCKRGKRYAPLTAIEEIQLDPIEGGIPVLITQADRKEILVALPLRYFLRLLKDAGHGEEK